MKLVKATSPDELRSIGVAPRIGVIGGSGLYDPGILGDAVEVQMHTPYGFPSDNLIVGRLAGSWVAFLPRHGRGHKYPPHKIPYKANAWALKAVGVSSVIAVSAVGSLRQDYAPGDFVVPDQFVDMTKAREYTFFDGPRVCHPQIGVEPFNSEIRRLLVEAAVKYNKVHDGGCYICIEGPRFSTKAESRIWRDVYACDIIGMTLVPEINLIREMGMCYGLLALVTDYDIWVPHQPVTADVVERTSAEKLDLAKKVLVDVIPRIPDSLGDKCSREMASACI